MADKTIGGCVRTPCPNAFCRWNDWIKNLYWLRLCVHPFGNYVDHQGCEASTGTICCLSLSSWGIESMGRSRNETHLQLFGRTALHLFLTPGQQGPFKPTISNKTRSFPGKTHWSLVKKTWSWAMLHFFPGLSHVQRNDKLHSIAPLICIFLVSW